MEQSILKSTKAKLDVEMEDTDFDLQIITDINSAFSALEQLGVGPLEGFMIEDDSTEWAALGEDTPQLNMVKTYVFLKVQLFFDMPTSSYLIAAKEKQIDELGWRIQTRWERDGWVDPNPAREEVEYE